MPRPAGLFRRLSLPGAIIVCTRVKGPESNRVKDYLLALVPMFVAVDPIGLLPLYVGLTEGLDGRQRRRIVWEAVLTALAVSIAFVFLGRSFFQLMGIQPADFLVAGGVLLFLIATLNLISDSKPSREIAAIGAVPLGTPLIAGPAVLTTALLLVGEYGIMPTLVSVVANILLTAVVLLLAGDLTRLLGTAGSRAVSKVVSLLLAAIAVMMVRKGLSELIHGTARIDY